MRILVTGGAGFIGSHYVRTLLGDGYPGSEGAGVTVLDKLTYSGNRDNLPIGASRLEFVHGDVCDAGLLDDLLPGHDAVVHFAAESHVDRSISAPGDFFRTNVLGTQVLLDAVMRHGVERTVHVSTDEVYGSIATGSWTEESPLAPNSPYAASKAGADLLARSYWRTHRLNVSVSRCSNNYGPYQHTEKLVPLFITNLLEGKQVPLYGDGHNVREWLHVDDHCRAIHSILLDGRPGEVYNVGGGNDRTNLALAERLLELCGADSSAIKRVADRLGHDDRYSLDDSKIRDELGYAPRVSLEDGLAATVAWYRDNPGWWKAVKRRPDAEVRQAHEPVRGSGGPAAAITPPASLLRPTRDQAPARGMERSARTTEGQGLATDDVPGWLAELAAKSRFKVERIPFADLDGWSFQSGSGNLVHRSGRFFSVEGIDVRLSEGPVREWQQPVINQPEVGVLGILVKDFGGVPHFLMQAKMEPGNPNLLQISPTVQATRSNYTKVHKGADVKYLEYFTDPSRGRVLADVLQSEHGSWFLKKSNRNMLVEAHGDVPLEENFCWLTLGQLGRLLRQDNVVNMDARTVLACVPLLRAEGQSLLTDTELRSRITAERSRHDVRVDRIPLAGVHDWVRGPESVDHVAGRYFRVMAVAVQADSREVTAWTQPLLEPVARGITAFVTRRFEGVPHVLAHARVEAGFLDTVELAPTVQHTPENYAHLDAADRPPFLDLVLGAPAERVRYEAVHCEEGGRFHHAESRYVIVEADEDQAPSTPPPGYLWVTPGQLNSLVRHGHYVNVQARSLLAVLNTEAVAL